MLNIIFNYQGTEIIIQCSIDKKMKDIFQEFSIKAEIDVNNIYFLYNGNIINEEIYFNQLISNEDRNRKIMNILVNDNSETIIKENICQSKEIICPECKQNILIEIKNYKINLSNCKIGHSLNNILLNKFENTQLIDISKIICDMCKIQNKSNIYNNIIYKCLNCNINLCPICKKKHDKEHTIINYDSRKYICNKHYENYVKYCKECKLNLCMKCEKEHLNHKGIYYGEILQDNDNNNELREYINKLKYEIKDITNKLGNIIENLEIYYKISYKHINNNNRNYEILKIKNEFINYNNIIIKDIKEIISDMNINNKFKNLMNIYENINNKNYIIGEIEIKKEDINKDIRIINSYENYKRKNKDENNNDYKYGNEKEIRENCKIIINNEIIPFSYYHRFEKEGKYQIKYLFKKNLIKTIFLFLGCSSLTNIDLSNFNTQNIINMNGMFYGCSSLTNINLSNFNTQNVTDMGCMFNRCSSLKYINLSNFNTQKVTNMNGIFYGCSSLNNINLSNFNTQNVTNMSGMFFGCSSLTNINLSNFNTQNVADMEGMFSRCSSLTNISLSNFKTQKVTNMNSMFSRCSSLKYINLSNFNTQNVTNMNSMFYGCSSLKDINLSNFNIQNVINMHDMFNGCPLLKNINLSDLIII